jgi:3-methyladenine DNA glycosylase AlkD
MVTDLLPALHAVLASVAEPARAPAMRAYMRDQFEYLGIPTPQRRLAAKPLLKQLKGAAPEILLQHASQLWEQPLREYQYIAIDLLAMHWKQLDVTHLPALFSLVQRKSWWDTVDGLAGVVSDVLRHQHDDMDDALNHNNFWMRRIALLHQLGWRDKTDAERLFAYCLARAHEKEFFIQKAIGWALRDYARHAPDEVSDFTQWHRAKLSALSFREANKHLD